MKQLVRLAGTSKAPMEIWIDADGLLRRMTTKMTMKMEGRPMTMTQRIEMYDFGTKVDVKIPGRDETIDASNLGAALGASFG